MALELVVDSLDKIEEPHRVLYVEKDGKFRLDVNGVEDVGGLKSALEKERERARELEKRFKGIDPEAVRKLEEERRAALEKSGDVEAVKAALLEAHGKEKSALESKLAALTGTLESKMLRGEAVSALAASGGNVNLLLPHVTGRLKMAEVDGDFVAQVLDDKGKARLNGDGSLFSIEQLVKEMAENDSFAAAFDGSGSAGSGAPARSGAGGGAIRSRKDLKTAKEKSDFIKKHGRKAFADLPVGKQE